MGKKGVIGIPPALLIALIVTAAFIIIAIIFGKAILGGLFKAEKTGCINEVDWKRFTQHLKNLEGDSNIETVFFFNQECNLASFSPDIGLQDHEIKPNFNPGTIPRLCLCKIDDEICEPKDCYKFSKFNNIEFTEGKQFHTYEKADYLFISLRKLGKTLQISGTLPDIRKIELKGPPEVENPLPRTWPLDDPIITSCYGPRVGVREDGTTDWHDGTDFRARTPVNVYSVADGFIYDICENYCNVRLDKKCERKCGGFGTNIIIAHQDTTFSRYQHLSAVYVRKGQKVSKGDVIALSGNTGYSLDPHLHFEIYYDNNFQEDIGIGTDIRDPLYYFEDLTPFKIKTTSTSCQNSQIVNNYKIEEKIQLVA